MHAREVRCPENGAATNAVEVGDFHHRVVVVDRIVEIACAPVGTDIEVGVPPRLPIPPVGGIVGWLHPIALLEAQDAHLRVGKAPCNGRAGCAGANDQNIHHLVLGHGSNLPIITPDRRTCFDNFEQRPIAVGHGVAFWVGCAGFAADRPHDPVITVVGREHDAPERLNGPAALARAIER